jgi:hypothetical protein
MDYQIMTRRDSDLINYNVVMGEVKTKKNYK